MEMNAVCSFSDGNVAHPRALRGVGSERLPRGPADIVFHLRTIG